MLLWPALCESFVNIGSVSAVYLRWKLLRHEVGMCAWNPLIFSSGLCMARRTWFIGLCLYLGDRPVHKKILSRVWDANEQREMQTQRLRHSENQESDPLLPSPIALLLDFRDNLAFALPGGWCPPSTGKTMPTSSSTAPKRNQIS